MAKTQEMVAHEYARSGHLLLATTYNMTAAAAPQWSNSITDTIRSEEVSVLLPPDAFSSFFCSTYLIFVVTVRADPIYDTENARHAVGYTLGDSSRPHIRPEEGGG